MPPEKLPGGPTQDEIMAVSLQKMGLRMTDTVLEIGCGTGKVSVAMARHVKSGTSIDIRPASHRPSGTRPPSHPSEHRKQEFIEHCYERHHFNG